MEGNRHEKDLLETVRAAEAELIETGSFFMDFTTEASGALVLRELKLRHPGRHVDGVFLPFVKVFALWSDDRLKSRS